MEFEPIFVPSSPLELAVVRPTLPRAMLQYNTNIPKSHWLHSVTPSSTTFKYSVEVVNSVSAFTVHRSGELLGRTHDQDASVLSPVGYGHVQTAPVCLYKCTCYRPSVLLLMDSRHVAICSGPFLGTDHPAGYNILKSGIYWFFSFESGEQ